MFTNMNKQPCGLYSATCACGKNLTHERKSKVPVLLNKNYFVNLF